MALSGIGAGVPSSTYQTNMQHIGGQTQIAGKKDLAPTDETEAHASTGAVGGDQVDLSGAGEAVDQSSSAYENAAHTGALGGAAREDGTNIGEDTEVPGEGTPGAGETQVPVGGGEVPGGGEEVPPEEGTPNAGAPDGPDGPSDDNKTGKTGGSNKADNAEDVQRTRQEQMRLEQEAAEARQQWETFWLSMMEQQQKHMAALMKIIADTQAEIFTILQDTARNQAEVGSRCARAWDDYIRGPR